MRLAYGSLQAFIAHYQLLQSQQNLTGEEKEHLASMNQVLNSMDASEREALFSPSPENNRHRERAERKLGRLLLGKSILSA